MVSMDASAELKQLSLAKAEGYEDIRIAGLRLDMDNDFKNMGGHHPRVRQAQGCW